MRSAQARAARAASSGGVGTASVSAPTPLFSAKQQAAFVALTQKSIKAASMAEGCDSGCGDTPWYPYECVPCPDGYSVDFYGLTCGKLCFIADLCVYQHTSHLCRHWWCRSSTRGCSEASRGVVCSPQVSNAHMHACRVYAATSKVVDVLTHAERVCCSLGHS